MVYFVGRPLSPPYTDEGSEIYLKNYFAFYCFLHKYVNFELSKCRYLRQQFWFTYLRSTL
jgi:hypothetical protein